MFEKLKAKRRARMVRYAFAIVRERNQACERLARCRNEMNGRACALRVGGFCEGCVHYHAGCVVRGTYGGVCYYTIDPKCKLWKI